MGWGGSPDDLRTGLWTNIVGFDSPLPSSPAHAATGFLWLAAIIAGAKFVDLLLREPQREWLSQRFQAAWIWLDDQRAGRFTTLLLRDEVQWVTTIASA